MMKHDEMVIYHIFTMGYCGAEATQVECDGIHHRLNKIVNNRYIRIGLTASIFGKTIVTMTAFLIAIGQAVTISLN